MEDAILIISESGRLLTTTSELGSPNFAVPVLGYVRKVRVGRGRSEFVPRGETLGSWDKRGLSPL